MDGNVKKLLVLALSGAAILGCQQRSEQTNQGDLDQVGQSIINKEDPSGFVSHAAISNMMEIRSGQIAQRSDDEQVRAFAAVVMQDHEKAHKELNDIVERRKLYIPTAVPPARQSMLMRLDSLKRVQRDYQYVELVVTEHEMAMPIFKRMAQQQNDVELGEFAKAKLPAMQQHLTNAKKMLNSLQSKVKSENSVSTPNQR